MMRCSSGRRIRLENSSSTVMARNTVIVEKTRKAAVKGSRTMKAMAPRPSPMKSLSAMTAKTGGIFRDPPPDGATGFPEPRRSVFQAARRSALSCRRSILDSDRALMVAGRRWRPGSRAPATGCPRPPSAG